MKTIFFASTVAALTVAAVATVNAAPGRPGPGENFSRLDKNGDGAVSLDEMTERQRDFFARADSNADGKLTQEEMRAFAQERRAEIKARRFPDENKDGVVSRQEYTSAYDRRFEELDADRDGKLTEDEIRAPRRGGQ